MILIRILLNINFFFCYPGAMPAVALWDRLGEDKSHLKRLCTSKRRWLCELRFQMRILVSCSDLEGIL